MELHARLGPIEEGVGRVLEELRERQAVVRMVGRDHTLWQDDPTEVADRLGWLDCPASMREHVPRLRQVADECGADGLERVVVLGMGGSSLFPEVLARTFGSRPHRLQITVLDTTHPAAVSRVTADWPAARTLFLAASKSGTTIETRSHLEHFWAEHPDPSCFAATTDPGSALGALAAERRFRATFENPPDIGGRYSALSLFGLVPAALGGISLDGLLDGGALALDHDLEVAEHLAAALAGGVAAGRDKLTFVLDHRIGSLGLWVEQLIAESTGKHGTGVLPVVDEPIGPPTVYGDDRVFVAIGEVADEQRAALDALAGAGHPVVHVPLAAGDLTVGLGHQVVLWEAATALCGAALDINPFDQPDVAAAKAATQAVLDAGSVPVITSQSAAEVLSGVVPGEYVAIHAYLDPGCGAVDDLERARLAIRDRLRVATTVGLGPRFLHSTGQLHKGGPPTGVFLQVIEPTGAAGAATTATIPGSPFGFGTLIAAQAAGDLATLRDRGLRAARVDLEDLLEWSTA